MLLNELVISFITGGLMVSTVTFIAKYTSQELGSIIWAAPITLVPSIILLWYNKLENIKIINFVTRTIPYLTLTFLWIIFFKLIIKKYDKKDKYCVIKCVIICSIIWILLALILYNLQKNYFVYL